MHCIGFLISITSRNPGYISMIVDVPFNDVHPELMESLSTSSL